MKPFITFVFLLLFYCCNAQSHLDSMILDLKNKIANSSQEDTTLVKHYNGLSYYTRKGNPEESLGYVQKALEIAEKINDRSGIFQSYENLGFLHMNKGEFSEAESYFKKVYDYAIEIDKKPLMAQALDNIGHIYYNQGDYKTALEQFEKSLTIKEKHSIPRDVGDSYLQVGLLSFYNGKGERAETLLLKAIEIFKVHSNPSTVKTVELSLAEVYVDQGRWKEAEELQLGVISYFEDFDDKLGLSLAYGNYGLLKKEMGDYDLALEQFQKMKKLGEDINNPGEILYGLTQIGNLNLEMGDLEQAKSNARKSMKLAKEIGDIRSEADALSVLGEAEFKMKELDLALENKLKALALYEKSGLMEMVAQGNNDIGRIHLALGNKKEAYVFFNKGRGLSEEIKSLNSKALSEYYLADYFYQSNQLDSASFYIDKSKKFFEKNEMKDNLKDVHELSYLIAKKEGDDKLALEHHEKLFSLSNQIYSDNAQKAISEERVRQNVKDVEEEKEKAELKAKLLSSRNTLYLILAGALLGLLLLGFYFYQKLRKSRKEIEDQKIQLEQLNATKDKFFGIIAHDIRSPIVALDGVGGLMEHYVEKDDKNKLKRLATRVDDTSKKLGGLLDNLLNWALLQQGVIPYHPKDISIAEATDNTLAMFKNNAEAKGVQLISNIDQQLKVNADESALNTILRNLVSNAIKFTPKDGTVSIGTEIKNDKVFIHVNDTGTGISAEKLNRLFSLDKKSEKGTAGEKGTGLGLTLVKELVELNKGVLNVNSTLNKGSTFSVLLPVA